MGIKEGRMLLIREIEVYAPEYLGVKDVLVSGNEIVKIADKIACGNIETEILDGKGKKLVPGFIDQHVHLIGGGGEGGFHTRTPETPFSKLIEAGITTVVGVLGTDSTTRTVENLLAKVKALKKEGISAYMTTGAYSFPSPTVTGSIGKDITFLEEVIGVKLAISDHRASHIDADILEQIASQVRTAGMFSGKAGICVLHMGDGRKTLEPVWKVLEQSEIPIRHFLPTHVNRKKEVWEEAIRFLEAGGYIDITSSFEEDDYLSAAQAIQDLKERNCSLEKVSFSSDGYGSAPVFDEKGNLLRITYSPVNTNHKEMKTLVEKYGVSLEEALVFLTSNPAKQFRWYPQKGTIQEGSDADFVILDDKLEIFGVITLGEVCLWNGKLRKKGTYEE